MHINPTRDYSSGHVPQSYRHFHRCQCTGFQGRMAHQEDVSVGPNIPAGASCCLPINIETISQVFNIKAPLPSTRLPTQHYARCNSTTISFAPPEAMVHPTVFHFCPFSWFPISDTLSTHTAPNITIL